MQKILNWIKEFFIKPDTFFHGVSTDFRSSTQKKNDYRHEEVNAPAPYQWIEKTSYKKYSIRDQNGSSSCIGQGIAKALETMTGVVGSAHSTYQRRKNFPDKGMWLQDGGDIVKNQGTTTEELDKSQFLTEEQMNLPVTCPTPIQVSNYVFSPIDINILASIIQEHNHIILTFKSTYDEWQQVPKVNFSSTDFWQHCVCAVDSSLYRGQKSLIIEDSWGHDSSTLDGQRIITEDYLKARCTGAMYLVPRAVPTPSPVMTYTFSMPLLWGSKGKDVVALQDFLKLKGFFPSSLASTGNFLNITAHAVQKWQVSNGIMDYANVKDFSQVRFGGKSIILANRQLSTGN